MRIYIGPKECPAKKLLRKLTICLFQHYELDQHQKIWRILLGSQALIFGSFLESQY